MNTPHYKDLEVEGSKPGKRRLNWGRWLVFALLVLLLLFAALGWLGRKYIARQALVQWCHDNALVCEANFERLGPGGAVISGVRVTAGEATPFSADEVVADLAWKGWTPSLSGVTVTGPELRGTLDERGIRFHGLESLGGSGEGGGGALPPVKIADGRVILVTSAGEIGASIDLEGEFPRSGELQLVLDPVSLSGPEGTLIWSEGRVELVSRDGQLEGEAFLDLSEADVRGVRARDVQLTLLLEAPLSGEGDTQIVWDADLSEGAWGGYALSQASGAGRAVLDRLPSADANAVLNAIRQASAEARVSKVSGSSIAARDVDFEVHLDGASGDVAGPVLLSAAEVQIAQGRASTVDLSATLSRTPAAGLKVEGRLRAAEAGLGAATLDDLVARLSLPDLFAAHEASLAAALRRALVKFNAELPLTVTQEAGQWSILSAGPVELNAASALVVDIAPPPSGHWLVWAEAERSIRGAVSARGGGLPAMAATLDLSMGQAGLSHLQANDISLAPWAAGGRVFSANLETLDYARTEDGGIDLTASGRLGVAGNIAGLDLSDSTVSGDLILASAKDGLQVSTPGQSCLILDSEGVGFGGVSFGAFRAPICPETRHFLTPGKAGLSGSARLGDLTMPVAFSSSTGSIAFRNAVMDWAGGDTVSLSAVADAITLSLELEDSTLGIEGAQLRLGMATRRNASPIISARLGDTRFSGSLIPARVSSSDFRFDATLPKSRIDGSLSADGVVIRDLREDPLYQPMTADLTATLQGSQLEMVGPLRLVSNGITVADTLLKLDVSNLNGMAAIESRDLEFQPGGLQPWRLSDRLRGVFTDARGHLLASARFDIASGSLDGTGEVSVSEFGFQTTRLGRVQGVNGTVTFSDLMSLTTAPGQVISVASLNPGVPLENGQVVFHLVDGSEFRVDSASFPFAGGELALPAFTWTLGAETQRVEVTAEGIELARLVEILKLPNTQATGTVSGRFPIDVDGTQVMVRDARLKADAQGGHLSYAGSTGDSAAAADDNVRMAFEALKDFDFTVLELGLDGNVRDRMTISLILEGKSRRGISYGKGDQLVTGQPFLFDITVNSALAELLRNTQYYTSQKGLTDAVVEQVKAKRLEETE